MAKTVRVRVAVAVDSTGHWSAIGGAQMSDKDTREVLYTDEMEPGESYCWLEAEVKPA